MKAVVRERYGAAGDVVEIVDVDRPAPGPGEVLLRVCAAGLNSADWRLTAAVPALARLGEGLRAPRNRRLGMDVSGIIDAVGEGVTAFAVGDAVFGEARGSFAEYVVAPVGTIAFAPSSIPLRDAAVLAIAGSTALQALRRGGDLTGKRVLVIGAGGGVGSFVVGLAASRGAVVTAVCSTDKVEPVRALGASRVIDYTRETISGSYDLIVELAVAASLRVTRSWLADGGSLVLSSGDGGRIVGPLARMLGSVVFANTSVLSSRVSADDLRELAAAVDAGELRPVISASYPLAEAAAAIEQLGREKTRGKVVLDVAA
ncbi:NADPH:quinone reductase-like Zn-dependent oxidoreductase [Microbacteriaceae bacterium SG_E_30_P1]|uniref:NADPH:quinone reductase-like Zn-dependent oxidoreductase n=1 Tax=Antiquaquibacter oligotrophicus TaxID=2880260 RepID=A0ABT6KNE8_9MICO|nr:NAD(P)-dependent alcohol dehydrogenase [Antiquaquibacter oligotrophicus]MDH6181530.1 NADPH:quinone reductase-like Zn-dependent oxidoreductase [Antiquaquibacter oligotrophicus]UDF12780.1 NAD(P)-dependent alcohol dehydrogenase [Antiquaquibacter oligotrophicus]